jgi:hypothetical protein
MNSAAVWAMLTCPRTGPISGLGLARTARAGDVILEVVRLQQPVAIVAASERRRWHLR